MLVSKGDPGYNLVLMTWAFPTSIFYKVYPVQV